MRKIIRIKSNINIADRNKREVRNQGLWCGVGFLVKGEGRKEIILIIIIIIILKFKYS